MATVLVVDDRAASREVARATLDAGGHDVVEASGGLQALNLVHAVHPDVVLADLVMPGMDGYEFVHTLRADADTAAIPVLLYTASYRPDETAPLAAAYGVARVVSKSSDPSDLLSAVEEALSRARPEAAGETDPAVGPIRTINDKLVETALALDESELRWSALAEISPVGIVLGRPDLKATYVNPSLSAIMGVRARDLLGHNWLACIPTDRHGSLRAQLLSAPQRHHATITHKDGSVRWVNVTVKRLTGSDPTQGFVAIVDDVTSVVAAETDRHAAEQRRQTEERDRITQRFDSLTRLSGAIAHDFNNILNVILSFAEFLEEAVGNTVGAVLTPHDAEAMTTDIDHIIHAGRRAAHLSSQLLTFGGRQVLQPRVVNLNTVVEVFRREFPFDPNGRIHVTTELEPALLNTRADPAQLKQIMTNLVENALDAVGPTGTVTLRTTNDPPDAAALGGRVHLTVTDDGIGMSPEVAERAMEPFFTTKAKGLASGLGLSTAYGLMRQAGGTLTIDSTPGRGTTIRMSMPAVDEPAETPAGPEAARVQPDGCILVVDDEDGVRLVAERILTAAGYRVITAGGGEEALEIVRTLDVVIDGVLTDVAMPGVTGADLAKALPALRPGIPVLFMSGHASALLTDEGILDSRIPIVSKPFTRESLLTALAQTLATSR